MAATGDEINDELNFIFKSLAEKRKQRPLYMENDEYFFSVIVQLVSSKLNEMSDNQIICRLYGSAAEDLKCIEGYDRGDMDIMIFPNSDNLRIHEELLEYSLANPLHVRIKGGDHPVLQSCLVEDTEYVATSALKNFNHDIFGLLAHVVFKGLTLYSEALSREEFLTFAPTPLKNSRTGPAATFNLAYLFKMNLPVELIESLAHWFCLFDGRYYTRQHAEILDKLILLLKDIETATDPISVCHRMLSCFSRFLGPENFDEVRVRGILGLSQKEAVQNGDQQSVTPEENDEDERSTGICSRLASPSNTGPDVTVTPKSFDVDHKSLEDLDSSILSQSAMPRDSVENSSELLLRKLSTSTQATESKAVEDNVMKQTNGDCNDGERKLETERQPRAKKEEMTSKDLPSNPKDRKDEMRERELRKSVPDRFVKHLLERKGAESQETQFKDTGRFKTGFDFIPAFRAGGWPKVAKEWIKRERKWPSPDIVDKVIQEGFYLVVKSPKNNHGNPGCGFRISFSHAEFLLSQEMNDIQRDCYHFLKKYYRACLSTQPKSLVSFHLKNIFLQTIEETGAEMWTESNRVDCMMKLLGNLLKALAKKDLRHFFVRSYNLFGEDYIENPEILESLASKVEQFIESPVQFLKELTQNQEYAVRIRNVPNASSEPTVPANSATRQRHVTIDEMPSRGNYDTQAQKEKTTVTLPSKEDTQDRGPVSSYRYHDLKDSYQEVTKELVNAAFNDADCRLATMDPLERSLVEDLRELGRKRNLTKPVEEILEVFDLFWEIVTFFRVMFSTEQNLRRRTLDAVRGLVEVMKHGWKEGDFPEFETILRTVVLDSLFDLNHILPSGLFIQMTHRLLDSPAKQAHPQVVYDIPLD